ncbi:MAG: bifunctional diaminohydroxyphosphoribosylaminopyrimidine deaminase/5-amino-6-(5-phosphoribosylamino)uracil reductase RibD [Pseudomonadota bacterium]
MDDLEYMRMALTLADQGRGFTSPNPMVGAVVVRDGVVVGQGWHRRAGGPHAEVHALDDAGEKARGGALYVTLEPCNHTGRTPPCTEKILASGVARVVVAMADPNPHVPGGGNAVLKARGLEVVCGVCEDQARRQNEVFVKHVTTGRPFVVIKCAATLDGRIATRTGDARWVTGPAARAMVHRLRHELDAIMVGIGTVMADDPQLTTRLPEAAGIQGKDPVRVILDTHLKIAPSAQVLRLDSTAETLIICGDSVPARQRRQIARSGVQVLPVATAGGRIDLNALMGHLVDRGLTSVLIEGGARVLSSALASAIVDKALFFYAPKILGGDDGVPICSGPGPERMQDSIRLRDVSHHRIGDDILIAGYLG